MAPRIIVSYDDTDNDRDALALGRLLAFSGAELSLAYVRHAQGGALEQKEAEDLLERGAEAVGAPDMPRHVVVNPGTSVGLAELAERENADVIVFGSEYRTAAGTVKPGISAHKLLLGGPAAIAVAPAGLRERPSAGVNTIGILDEGDDAARATADSLAAALGASVVEFKGAPGRPARRRLAARVAAGQGHPQRLQRLRGRGGDLPGARRPARRRDPLRGRRARARRRRTVRARGAVGQRLGLAIASSRG